MKISFVLKVFWCIEFACSQHNFNEGILDVRLVGGNVSYVGGVEVSFTDKVNGETVWLPVCQKPNHANDEEWGKEESWVTCKQLKHQGGWPYTYQNDDVSTIGIDDVRCRGDESTISQCTYDGEGFLDDSQCGVKNQAGVKCYDRADVRLVDNPTNRPYQGVVEVKYNIGSTDWMEVCYQGDRDSDREWNLQNARVVCSQIGYPGVMKTYQGTYYRLHEIWSIDNIDCEGSEESIGDCFADLPREFGCNPENKAEVVCFLPGYLGCFSEDNGVILPHFQLERTSMTIVKCHDHCRGHGYDYIYAGLIGGTTCRCGRTQDFTKREQLPDAECSSPCSGEESLTCGGESNIAIYRVNQNVCDDPGVPSNSERIGDSFAFGSIVSFECDMNYDLIGESTIQCIMGDTPNSVRWNADPPICQGIAGAIESTTKDTPTPAILEGEVDHPVDIGLLVGILAAALLLIVLIIAVICFIIRRKKMVREDNIAASERSGEFVYPSPVFDPAGDNAYFDPAMAQAAAAGYPDYEDFALPEKNAVEVGPPATNEYDSAMMAYGATAAMSPPDYDSIPEKKPQP